ncbi:MAG: hypothetical protein GTO02_07270 [Candidatus Dadabacteria bacterium]|nr:hypothetical protein [Candidatus Dadabacteria bacterium]NIQ14195.1 hypothetical protein [Candidatus Dadabacteria bacterium]
MFGNFVGIDISGNTAKAVLINKGLREVKLLKTLITEFSREDEVSFSEFKRLLSGKFIPQNAKIITGISSTPLSLRVLDFPFKDPKKVEQVYKFEINSISTFKAESKQMDYQFVELDKGSEAMVCMFEKDELQDYLDQLWECGIDPKYVTFSPFAFSSINDLIDDERPILLINMDSENLNFTLFDDNGLRRVRSSNDTVSQIKENLNLNQIKFSDIEKNKELKSEFLKNISLLTDEIKRTSHYFEMETKTGIETFLITGDICNISNIENELENELGSKIKRLLIPELGSKDSATFSTAYSLAQYGCNFNNKSYNLRSGDYKYTGPDLDIRRTFALPLVLLAILFLFLVFKNTTGHFSTRGEIRSINSQMQKEIKSSFPNVSNIPDPVLFLENELEKIQDKLDILSEVKGGSTPLDIIRDISSSIPIQQRISVDEVRFESNKRVKIWGKCDSYKEIATIEKSLIDSGKFEKVDREQVSRAVNNTIKFVISLVLK